MKFICATMLFTLCFRSYVSFLFNIQRDLLSAIEIPTVYKMIIVDNNTLTAISQNETVPQVTKHELHTKQKHRPTPKKEDIDIVNKVRQ